MALPQVCIHRGLWLINVTSVERSAILNGSLASLEAPLTTGFDCQLLDANPDYSVVSAVSQTPEQAQLHI